MEIKIVEIHDQKIADQMGLGVLLDRRADHVDHLVLGAVFNNSMVGAAVFRYAHSGFLQAFLEYVLVDDGYTNLGIGTKLVKKGIDIFRDNGYALLSTTVSGDLGELYTMNGLFSHIGFKLYDTMRHRLTVDSDSAKNSMFSGHYKHILDQAGEIIDYSKAGGDILQRISLDDMHMGTNTSLKFFKEKKTGKIEGYICYEKIGDDLLKLKKLSITHGDEKVAGPILFGLLLDSFNSGVVGDDGLIIMEFKENDKMYNALTHALGAGYIDEFVNEYLMIL